MKLTEADEMKWFKLKLGLPCYPFDRPPPEKLRILMPPSPVLYDHFEPRKETMPLGCPGIHVFHVNDHDNVLDGKHFVFILEGYEGEYIEGPIEPAGHHQDNCKCGQPHDY